MALPFKVVKGSEAAIKSSNPLPGYLWFALDTRKIYYSDGTDFISMGGNSSVFFGTLTWDPDHLPDTDQVEFEFLPSQIEGNSIPNVDDLILNSDGCFYRVMSIEDNGTLIRANKLTIAGSGSGGGGGGGGGGGITTSVITIAVPAAAKYFLSSETNPTFEFSVHSTLEAGNKISKITYQLGNRTFEDNEPHNFGDITLNLSDYFNVISETGTSLSFVVEDLYGARKTSSTYTLRKIKLGLTADANNSSEILQATEQRLQYKCVPRGSTGINNVVMQYNIYNASHSLIQTITQDVININGLAVSQDINFADIDSIGHGLGTYFIDVSCSGKIGTQTVKSNILSHSIISYGVDPVLVAYLPTTGLEQYQEVTVSYEIAKTILDNQKARISFSIDNKTVVQEVEYNKIYTYSVTFDTVGYHTIIVRDTYGHEIEFTNLNVSAYNGLIPAIINNDIDLKLNLTARGRNNNELPSSRALWQDDTRTGVAVLSNFTWGDVNGWIKDDEGVDMLHISSGANLVVNGYEPFGLNSNNQEGMVTGKSIELDFKITNVTDYTKALITCLSYTNEDNIRCGFHITGEAATFNTANIKATGGTIIEDDEHQEYNTQIQGLTSKFAEGERIHLTWVVQRRTEEHPMIKTYINGILSGISEYTGGSNGDSIAQNTTTGVEHALIKVNSNYGTVDLYNIRVFDKVLSDRDVLSNYIATLPTIDDRAEAYQNNIGLLDSDGNISVLNIESGNYNITIPYIKFTGGGQCRKDDDGYHLTNADGYNHLPRAKKDYRLVNHFDFVYPTDESRSVDLVSEIDATKDNLVNGVVMYGQGTSSMEYPVKNLRIKFKMKKNGKKVKFQVNPDDYPVDILTLKADYMESSSSHNTGTANFVFSALEALGLRTPGQIYWNAQHPDYKTLTAIRGYPIICFFREDEDHDFEYIGRYNLNMDKSSEDAFGFLPVPETLEDIDENGSNIEFGWMPNDGTTATNLSPLDNPYVNGIHCYEFLNNASNLDNFICPDKYRKALRDVALDTFDRNETYYIKNGENYTQVPVPTESNFDSYYVKQNFERLFYQKEYNEDHKVVANWLTSFESRYPEESEDVESFYRMCAWLNSTNPDEANPSTPLSRQVTWDGITYTTDSADYRLAKFKNEFEEHFNKPFVLFYYVITHILLMIDSRAKNMMIATWDNQHWYPIFYDMDTMLGLNNYGYNKFEYNVEDNEDLYPNVYNGQNSVLWLNLRRCFDTDIRAMYNDLQEDGGLTYENLLRNYNEVQADMWNEIMYNYDAEYKYIRPYAEGYYDGKSGQQIEAGQKSYLYAAQGSRSMHRRYWLNNRIQYFNGKYLSAAYTDDKFTMRIYTPNAGSDNYIAAEVNADNFVTGTYYTRTGDENTGYTFTLASSYQSGVEYFIKADNRLANSLAVVPPSNNYTLTPLHNQYLAVAFGGKNGQTSGPFYAPANVPYTVVAPAGAKYNDTETYVYGGSQLKDLGDLSPQYLGLFQFPGTTKLERLILGNRTNGYYNPNFSALQIGTAAPQLKYLDISNTQLKGVLDLSACQNIEEVQACGSSLTGVVLPSYGILKVLRLPSTTNTLSLNNQTLLTNENFTIGTYDSTNELYTSTNEMHLETISIEGMPQFDSYWLAKLNANVLSYYCFRDVNWSVNVSDIVDTTDGLKGISTLETILARGVTPIKDGEATSSARALTGTVSFTGTVDAADVLKVYEHYQNIFPDLQFAFDENSVKYVNLYDGDGNLYWSKPIAVNTYITEAFFNNSSYGAFSIPNKTSTAEYQYTFANAWLIDNDSAQRINGEKPIYANAVTSNLYLYPVFTQSDQTYTVTYYINGVKDTEEQYPYGTLLINTLPKKIPFSSNNAPLSLENTLVYPFLGYSSFSDDSDAPIFDFTNETLASNQKFYAVFGSTQVEVKDPINVFYPAWEETNLTTAYYRYQDSDIGGCVARPKSGWNFEEFVTVPATTQDGQQTYNVVGGFSGHTIRRVYFANDSNITYVNARAFQQCGLLVYFEFTNELQVIGESAFSATSLSNNRIGGNNTLVIGTSAFNQWQTPSSLTNIIIASSVKDIGGGAFSYMKIDAPAVLQQTTWDNKGYRDITIQIGTQAEKSALILSENTRTNPMFNQNSNYRIKNLEFYSNIYSSDSIDISYFYNNGYDPLNFSVS